MFGAIFWQLAYIQTVMGPSRVNAPVRPKSRQS
jgi:hypothetical protein